MLPSSRSVYIFVVALWLADADKTMIIRSVWLVDFFQTVELLLTLFPDPRHLLYINFYFKDEFGQKYNVKSLRRCSFKKHVSMNKIYMMRSGCLYTHHLQVLITYQEQVNSKKSRKFNYHVSLLGVLLKSIKRYRFYLINSFNSICLFCDSR